MTAAHVVDPVYPGAVDEIVNLGDHWDEKYLQENKQEIKSLTQEITKTFNLAYDRLAQAQKERAAEFEELSKNLDNESLSACANSLIEAIFYSGLPQVRHFFATAVTPIGWMGFAQEISAACPIRYILKGGRANAASQILQAVKEAAMERGHNADVYHHTMDPQEVEMLVLPGIGVAIVDGECVGIAELAGDRIVNIFAEPGEELAVSSWRQVVDEAAGTIAEAKEIHNKLEAYYIKAMDFEAVDKIAKEIFSKIWAMAAAKEKQE